MDKNKPIVPLCIECKNTKAIFVSISGSQRYFRSDDVNLCPVCFVKEYKKNFIISLILLIGVLLTLVGYSGLSNYPKQGNLLFSLAAVNLIYGMVRGWLDYNSAQQLLNSPLKCLSCSEMNDSDAVFCIRCGTKFS